uniref:Progonadoliberin n=1 Tax=Salarias fasciatus TaxID=181472 RepID=A0A672HXR2_SALFA
LHRSHKMAARTLASWLLLLLLLGVGLPQTSCQHWSYGLNPGGKRELDSLADTLGNVIEGFPPCSVLGCAEESPLVKIYRMKGLLGSVTDSENGHRSYKK